MSNLATLSEVLDRASEAAASDALTPTVKLGTRPQSNLAPVDTRQPTADSTLPKRELTLFERTDIQRAEVQLQMHRRTEELLLEQVKLAQEELTGVRRVIAGVEALLAEHGEMK